MTPSEEGIVSSAFMLCDRCHEPIHRLEDGGWQCREEPRRDIYAHYGLCPAEKDELWKRIYLARWSFVMDRPVESGASLVEPEVPVQLVP